MQPAAIVLNGVHAAKPYALEVDTVVDSAAPCAARILALVAA